MAGASVSHTHVAGRTNAIIPLDITALRETATNAIQNLAAHGGLMASDSTPALGRVNGATDKALVVTWAASDTTEVQFPPVVKPLDMDTASGLEIHLLAKMSGATDTPTIDVQVFDGIGDTEMGGETAALSDDWQDLSVAIAASDLATPPGMLHIALIPGAHTTDTLSIQGAWIEYVKK